ncbi:hypothetical protein NGM33_05060 [Nocardiopsis dassonvillei]|uniref:hypothetical protein n=1 Tax=Nocardiopsis dassonvillei TaxID=2014 RepID=UPI0010CFD169|nr:hypothetical protein [Nocardiopsis dassonvillei]MCP3012692.1 hypothetical protein [Nocardiopsis dassonvillei]
MAPRSKPPENARPLTYTIRSAPRPPDPGAVRVETAAEASFRIASGGAIHAFLVLLMPFSVSDHLTFGFVLIVLTSVYAVLLTITTLPGLIAFLLERRRASARGAPTLRATKAAPSAVAALLYACLPASLILTEGLDAFVIATSLFIGLFGYLVHRACLAVTFSSAAGAVVRAVALIAPLLLILGLASALR